MYIGEHIYNVFPFQGELRTNFMRLPNPCLERRIVICLTSKILIGVYLCKKK